MVVFIISKPNPIPKEVYKLGKRVEDDLCLWLLTNKRQEVTELLKDCKDVRNQE
jgi:hypothetical protein